MIKLAITHVMTDNWFTIKIQSSFLHKYSMSQQIVIHSILGINEKCSFKGLKNQMCAVSKVSRKTTNICFQSSLILLVVLKKEDHFVCI